MKLKRGTTSFILERPIQDTRSNAGGLLHGLAYNSPGLGFRWKKAGDATWTAIPLAAGTVGAFVNSAGAGSGGGFAETPENGVYAVSLPDGALAAGSTTRVLLKLDGAANMLPLLVEIELDALDYQDGVRAGLTALPNAAARTSGGLAAQIDMAGIARPYKNTWYVRPGGNDAGDGLSPATALASLPAAAAVASAGDLVLVGPGVYTLSAPLVLPSQVTLAGAGRRLTTIGSSAALGASGLVQVGTDGVLRDLNIRLDNAGKPLTVAAGAQLVDLDAYGDSDGLWAAASCKAWRCNFSSRFDAVRIAGAASMLAEFFECTAEASGTATDSTTHGLSAGGGTARWHGGHIFAVTANAGASAVAAVFSDVGVGLPTVELLGVRRIYSTGISAAKDIQNVAGAVFVSDCQYDKSKVAGTIVAGPIPDYALAKDGSGRAELAATGLDAISTLAPSGPAGNFREMLVQLWRRFFKRSTLSGTQLKTFADDGTTPITTQSVTDDGAVQTQGSAL